MGESCSEMYGCIFTGNKMVSVCFYFQVHQPYRVRKYSVFDIGKNHNYFDEKKNKEIMQKVAKKCYLPANKVMLELIKKHKGKFKISYSISGTAIEQFEKYCPEVLESFKKLVKTGHVEILAETYYHSLAYLYSKKEFDEQVKMHAKKIKKVFGVIPNVFRNTELTCNNEMACYMEKKGYKGILAEGADYILGWRSPNFLYGAVGTKKIKLLLKNYRLSDDIAFRFGNKGWIGYPLTADKFARWVNEVNGNGETVNLFMDYETFGEHQWEDKGIFDFMRHLPGEILKYNDNEFLTPSEVIDKYPVRGVIDMHNIVSWADIERDLSAWIGNKMQQSAINEVYIIGALVRKSKNKKLLEKWRKLLTSDHFYYMCTKYFNDGDVHKYFSPYDTPYDAYISYMNILTDFKERLKKKS
jgi:alpha-amylase